PRSGSWDCCAVATGPTVGYIIGIAELPTLARSLNSLALSPIRLGPVAQLDCSYNTLLWQPEWLRVWIEMSVRREGAGVAQDSEKRRTYPQSAQGL
ncbi:hypothetical protein U1Q18_026411, partial [Sarracenia purpurea var. burkii]